MQAKLIALLVALLAFAGLGLWGQHEHAVATKAKAEVAAVKAERDSLQAANKDLLRDSERKDAINLAKQRTINQLAAEAAKNQQALNEALKANRTWADAPVPDGVWDAIRPDPDGKAVPGPSVDGTRPGTAAGGPGQRSPRAVRQGAS